MNSLTRGEKQNRDFMKIYEEKIQSGIKPQRALREAREEAERLGIVTKIKW